MLLTGLQKKRCSKQIFFWKTSSESGKCNKKRRNHEYFRGKFPKDFGVANFSKY